VTAILGFGKLLLGDRLVAPKRCKLVPDGWCGEVVAFEPHMFGLVLVRLRGTDAEDLREVLVGQTELETLWTRAPRDPVQAAAQRGGWAYYPSVDDAIGGEK
jgi:hypothetical protein